MKRGLLLLIFSLFFGISAMAQVEAVAFMSPPSAMNVNETAALTATITPSDASKAITFTSSHPDIIEVATTNVNDTVCNITAKKAGTATITATSTNGVTTTCVVTVTAATEPVTGVAFKLPPSAMNVNETVALTATITPSDASNKALTFTSSHPDIIEVATTNVDDTVCTITAKKAGTATITVTSKDDPTVTTTCTIIVSSVPVTAVAFKLPPSAMNVNETATLTATITPSDASNKALTFTSSHPDIIEVATTNVDDTVCNITAKKVGTATITVTSKDDPTVTTTCTIIVSSVPVTAVAFKLPPSAMNVNETATLTATITPSDASNKALTFTSSHPDIIEVATTNVDDTVCNITAKKVGTATITVTSKDDPTVTTTCTIIVSSVPVTGITLNHDTLKKKVGDPAVTLTAIFDPVNATNKTIKWFSLNASVATVNVNNGTVNFTGIGKTKIIAETLDGGLKDTCVVQVDSILVTKIELNKDTAYLAVGDSVALTYVITPTNATEKGATWVSLNTNIATVSANGMTKAKAIGKTSIIVTSKNSTVRDTCIVEVSQAQIPVTGVSLNKDSIGLIEGDTLRLTATIAPATATNKNVTWTSKNVSIAIVSSTGLITARKAGKTEVYVTSANGGKRDTCIVMVREKVIFTDPVTATGRNGQFPISLNLPDNEKLTGVFTIKFPAGIELDVANTKLLGAFLTSSSLSIKAEGNNSWKVEIKDNELRSMLRATTNKEVLSVAYILNKSVANGTHNVSITNASFKLSGGSEIKEEQMDIKLKVSIDPNSNDLIDSEKASAYVVDNRLYIQSAQAETIYVYSFNGALLYAKEKTAGEVIIDLNIQEPILIVKGTSGWTQKVAK